MEHLRVVVGTDGIFIIIQEKGAEYEVLSFIFLGEDEDSNDLILASYFLLSYDDLIILIQPNMLLQFFLGFL